MAKPRRAGSRQRAPVRPSALSRAASSVDSDAERFCREAQRSWLVNEVNIHLDAYILDRNPVHILEGVLLLSEHGEPLDDTMRRNLRLAIRELSKRISGKGMRTPPRNAIRDVRILRELFFWGHGEIEKKIRSPGADAIAKRHGVSVDNLRMIVSRYRKLYDSHNKSPDALIQRLTYKR